MNATVKDFIDAFADEQALQKLKLLLGTECRVLLDAGADVIVPAGGLPMMLFGGTEMEGAPVVNGITLIAKSAEMAIKLRRLGMAKVSRRSNYVKPPEKALREFLEQGWSGMVSNWRRIGIPIIRNRRSHGQERSRNGRSRCSPSNFRRRGASQICRLRNMHRVLL